MRETTPRVVKIACSWSTDKIDVTPERVLGQFAITPHYGGGQPSGRGFSVTHRPTGYQTTYGPYPMAKAVTIMRMMHAFSKRYPALFAMDDVTAMWTCIRANKRLFAGMKKLERDIHKLP